MHLACDLGSVILGGVWTQGLYGKGISAGGSGGEAGLPRSGIFCCIPNTGGIFLLESV